MDPLKQLIISPTLLRQIAELDEFKGRWQALGSLAPDRLSALRRMATIESVGSSTRIEGSRLSDADVEALLSGLDIRSFRSRDEQEVAGYSDAMQLIFDAWRDMALTEGHVKQLHGVLLGHSDEVTATPFDTPRAMEALLGWAHQAFAEGHYHPLLVVGVFLVRFLAIHPFHDGNGRLSRLLTTLLLLRAGYEYVPYSSLERVIEENKDAYYVNLRRAQATLDGDESRLGAWLDFFLDCLLQQKDVLARKLERERTLAPLAPLDEQLVRAARENGRITISAAESFTGANRNTIKVRLRYLVEAGHLTLRGSGRGAWYEPL